MNRREKPELLEAFEEAAQHRTDRRVAGAPEVGELDRDSWTSLQQARAEFLEAHPTASFLARVEARLPENRIGGRGWWVWSAPLLAVAVVVLLLVVTDEPFDTPEDLRAPHVSREAEALSQQAPSPEGAVSDAPRDDSVPSVPETPVAPKPTVDRASPRRERKPVSSRAKKEPAVPSPAPQMVERRAAKATAANRGAPAGMADAGSMMAMEDDSDSMGGASPPSVGSGGSSAASAAPSRDEESTRVEASGSTLKVRMNGKPVMGFVSAVRRRTIDFEWGPAAGELMVLGWTAGSWKVLWRGNAPSRRALSWSVQSDLLNAFSHMVVVWSDAPVMLPPAGGGRWPPGIPGALETWVFNVRHP